jgi:hypothetical protein
MQRAQLTGGHVQRLPEREAFVVGLGVRGAEDVQQLAPGSHGRDRRAIEVQRSELLDQGAVQAGRVVHAARSWCCW